MELRGVMKMKLNEGALAKGFGVLGAVYFLACYFVALLMPNLYKAVAASWFHMLDLSSAWKNVPSGFLLGLISFTLASWVSGWLLAKAYNMFIK